MRGLREHPRSMGEAGYCTEKSPSGLESRLSARRLDYRSDVAVFKYSVGAFHCFPNHNVHHGPRQVVGRNHLVGEQHPKYRVNSTEKPVAEIRLLPRLDRVDIGRSKYIDVGEPRGQQRVFGFSLIACEGHPASSRRVRAVPAQERECRVGAAAVENARELDGVVNSDLAEFRVRYGPGIRTEAKNRRGLIRKHLRECGAVSEVWMQNLCQLGMRYAKLPAPDRRHTFNSGMVERVAKGVAADHSRRAHHYDTVLFRRTSVHDNARSSIQST